jgi:dihydroxy-acid dehydratase
VVYPVAEPFSPAGNHITVISGSLAPESALIKLSGKLMKTFEGPAQCYNGEQAAFEVRCVPFPVYGVHCAVPTQRER